MLGTWVNVIALTYCSLSIAELVPNFRIYYYRNSGPLSVEKTIVEIKGFIHCYSKAVNLYFVFISIFRVTIPEFPSNILIKN